MSFPTNTTERPLVKATGMPSADLCPPDKLYSDWINGCEPEIRGEYEVSLAAPVNHESLLFSTEEWGFDRTGKPIWKIADKKAREEDRQAAKAANIQERNDRREARQTARRIALDSLFRTAEFTRRLTKGGRLSGSVATRSAIQSTHVPRFI